MFDKPEEFMHNTHDRKKDSYVKPAAVGLY